MNNIAIFASGSGTNAENLIHYFKDKSNLVRSIMVITNNNHAGVINRCKRLSIPVFIMNNKSFEYPEVLLTFLRKNNIDWILLAGFLRKIHLQLIENYEGRIINIHPALLPKYGGKGMYGHFVHEAVIAAKEPESGITIHFVNQNYDEGAIIFQAKCSLDENDNALTLASKIHELEQQHFPLVVEQLLKEKNEK